MSFAIHAVPLGAGEIAVSALPGRWGAYAADLKAVVEWGPRDVVSMTTRSEMALRGASGLASDLDAAGVRWWHMPLPDFGAPRDATGWPALSRHLHQTLAQGGRVLVHCHGGCGRSGMIVTRLMVEHGETGPDALHRLRTVRPCAVETQAQMDWAFSGSGRGDVQSPDRT
ncbi:protein-tyrosine phosphatase family protein [Pseudaestuariivita sp.]|uniref:protein-tyrosine phosphatase family protein n=1 Tax=Pseudaestuariivita sp. TaxID=2211669 RepID=UPI00405A0039